MSHEKTKIHFKPCPFCGNSEFVIHERPSPDKTIVWHTITHPATVPCSVSMIECELDELTLKWNTRK